MFMQNKTLTKETEKNKEKKEGHYSCTSVLMKKALSFYFIMAFLISMQKITNAARDTITLSQFLTDKETIVSPGGSFEMGFLNGYVSIWYKQLPIKTEVWTANRDTPLTNTSSAVLKMVAPGQLVLVDGNSNNPVWSTNNISRSIQDPITQLLDSGNLVVRDANDDNPKNFLWQSFDYPTDTLLPGMKLGKNLVTGHEVYLTARKREDDLSTGLFTLHLDNTGYPQVVIRNASSDEIYKTGPWNGIRWSGTPGITPDNPIYKYEIVMNPREVYSTYTLINSSAVLFRLVLSSTGVLDNWSWAPKSLWKSFLKAPVDICDTYAMCGGNGVCNMAESPVCGCLENFVYDTTGGWNFWSDGCHRKTPLKCQNGTDGFKKYSGVKLPDTMHSWFNTTMNLKDCEQVCLKNCSCTAYSNLDITKGGSGCLLWFDNLTDMRVLTQHGQDIYIRLDSSELSDLDSSSKEKNVMMKVKIIIASLLSATVMILLGLSLMHYIRKQRKKEIKMKKDLELPFFDLSTITRATNNFSDKNKLGEGGFGAVYMGVLDDKQKIAVKRLSKTSKQGEDEFKNEAIYIAKLQHRNLVKLLGCCVQGEEKLLVYEFMPNKSLDSFIFDETKRKLLDWPKRFTIINGIARGLMYLHQDSRLRIIHRDLKASNVLLDTDMNPKISDFGLARSVGGDAMGANTNRIVGTHGYISPEYASEGIFSIKSDVFSFGVVVLEIVSGKRNRGFFHQDHGLNLIGHAWKLYKEARALELTDEHLASSSDEFQVQRSIHVGLLCVQQCPEDRPNMSSAVAMLSNDSALPEAKEPGFFTERKDSEGDSSSSTQRAISRNEFTITILEAR